MNDITSQRKRFYKFLFRKLVIDKSRCKTDSNKFFGFNIEIILSKFESFVSKLHSNIISINIITEINRPAINFYCLHVVNNCTLAGTITVSYTHLRAHETRHDL